MKRRQFLVTIGVAGVAGCSGGNSGATGNSATETPTMTPGSGPAEPVIRHYQALDRNDIEAANAAIHNDSPTGGQLPQDAVEQARNSDFVIKEIEVLSESSDSAVVRVVFTATNTDTGTQQTNELRIEVRRAGDEWKMWSIRSFETLTTTQNG